MVEANRCLARYAYWSGDAAAHGLDGPGGGDEKEPEGVAKPLRKVRLTRFVGGGELPLEQEDSTSTSPGVVAQAEETWDAVGIMERFSIDAVRRTGLSSEKKTVVSTVAATLV
ncbi:hypothetical protein RB195_023567 [Necator americanus]|uniref:Uncharacterized protein n=1 Tax=Necator americanus TaxID=51031 RepID=A0ABR1EJT0_NECAM